jgi:hypothetical protein
LSKRKDFLANLEQKIDNLKQDLVSDLSKINKKIKKLNEIRDIEEFKGNLFDRIEEIEQQVNIVVLSLFFSFVIQNNWSKLNSVFLDDPIQNMDDINIFSFVDVIRSLYINNADPIQLFISTHDRKLYLFLKKKFRNLNVLVLEFNSYDKAGPVILRR